MEKNWIRFGHDIPLIHLFIHEIIWSYINPAIITCSVIHRVSVLRYIITSFFPNSSFYLHLNQTFENTELSLLSYWIIQYITESFILSLCIIHPILLNHPFYPYASSILYNWIVHSDSSVLIHPSYINEAFYLDESSILCNYSSMQSYCQFQIRYKIRIIFYCFE